MLHYIHEGINNSFSEVYNKPSAYISFYTQLIFKNLIVNRFFKKTIKSDSLATNNDNLFTKCYIIPIQDLFILDVNLSVFFEISICASETVFMFILILHNADVTVHVTLSD